jgi:two-component system, LuxR family, response regulator FixJ
MSNLPTVFLVDPDGRFTQSCRKLLEPHQVVVLSFDSPQDFLVHSSPTKLGCIVTELQFPGENAIDFTNQLKQRGWSLPVIIHTAYGDVSSCSRAFRAGVSDFLEKTIPPDMLLTRLLEIIAKCRHSHADWLSQQNLANRWARLTDREKEVARALVDGQTMKAISNEFGTSFQSVARHRQRILLKLEVENDVELANLLRNFTSWHVNIEAGFDSMLATVQD